MIALSFQAQEEFVAIKAKVLREASPHVNDDTSVQFAFSCERRGWVFWSGDSTTLRAQISISQSNYVYKTNDLYKASKALIPEGALDEQVPSQQLTGMVHRALIIQSHFRLAI